MRADCQLTILGLIEKDKNSVAAQYRQVTLTPLPKVYLAAERKAGRAK